MASVTYEVVAHDGGYAYKVGDVFSETFPTHADAREAAEAAARRQQEVGGTQAIQYEDADGVWHTEMAKGTDRPAAAVCDTLDAGRTARRPADIFARQPPLERPAPTRARTRSSAH
jgi:hypothetical protein